MLAYATEKVEVRGERTLLLKLCQDLARNFYIITINDLPRCVH